MKTNVFFALLFSVIIHNNIFSQQRIVGGERLNLGNWQPIKITASGDNTINGVSFYNRTESCNSEDILIIKLVNKNNHPVKVKWKELSEIEKTVTLGPSSELEGTCLAFTNKDPKNMQYNLSINKSKIDAEGKFKKFALDNLQVVEEK